MGRIGQLLDGALGPRGFEKKRKTRLLIVFVRWSLLWAVWEHVFFDMAATVRGSR